MSYAEQSANYRDPEKRNRMEMAVREQGVIYSAGEGSTAELGRGVTAGVATDIGAVIAAVSVSPNWAVLDNDADLLAAVQSVWPTVAAALYPEAV